MLKKYLPHTQILLGGSLWGFIGLFNRRRSAGGPVGVQPMSITVVLGRGCIFVSVYILR